MNYSRKLLRPKKESGATVMCRQGVVNTRQSGVLVALFTRLLLDVGGSVSPCSARQVLVCHVGNVLAHFMSGERWGWWRVAELCFLLHFFWGPPDRADYGVLLTQTNC